MYNKTQYTILQIYYNKEWNTMYNDNKCDTIYNEIQCTIEYNIQWNTMYNESNMKQWTIWYNIHL